MYYRYCLAYFLCAFMRDCYQNSNPIPNENFSIMRQKRGVLSFTSYCRPEAMRAWFDSGVPPSLSHPWSLSLYFRERERPGMRKGRCTPVSNQARVPEACTTLTWVIITITIIIMIITLTRSQFWLLRREAVWGLRSLGL